MPVTDPTWIFFLVMLIILFAPIVMSKLRIPHIIGMVLAGVIIGQYGLNILVRDNSFELFGRVGLYYIMFLAGLEMDMEGLKKNRLSCAIFGFTTFIIPFVLAILLGKMVLGYSTLAALLLGCILSSNTLVTYPIVSRYGLQRHVSVTLSVGSSMIAMMLALIILAAVSASYRNVVGFWYWVWFGTKFVLFCAGEIFFLPRITRWFLRKYSDAVMQFVFVMSVLFFSAALSEVCGLEGIFGAFMAGLIINRYIPHVSPLMNRIEFIGNALFIPYFLIGVGMLINVRPLFTGWHTIFVVLCLVITGTVAKIIAAYASAFTFRLSLLSGHIMCGLTTAHAAGAIAIVMVGMKLGLMDNEVLNGIVLMVLFSCIISSFITEGAAKRLALQQGNAAEETKKGDDEKMLIPVARIDTADTLVDFAIMMRNPKLNRGLIGLNVVYDDLHSAANQAKGRKLLERIVKTASAADVRMMTQSRLSTNLANGIMHTFKEYDASEILLGLHDNNGSPKDFWGSLTVSLVTELSCQLMLIRCIQPANTLRRIQVAVPEKAQYEPGFYRWVERLSRLADNLGCLIQFHARNATAALIKEYIRNRHNSVRADYMEFNNWDNLPDLATKVNDNHLFVVITARPGTVSYLPSFEKLPAQLTQYYSSCNLMVLFPDQYGASPEAMTFIAPKRQEEKSAYKQLRNWVKKRIKIVKWIIGRREQNY